MSSEKPKKRETPEKKTITLFGKSFTFPEQKQPQTVPSVPPAPPSAKKSASGTLDEVLELLRTKYNIEYDRDYTIFTDLSDPKIPNEAINQGARKVVQFYKDPKSILSPPDLLEFVLLHNLVYKKIDGNYYLWVKSPKYAAPANLLLVQEELRAELGYTANDYNILTDPSNYPVIVKRDAPDAVLAFPNSQGLLSLPLIIDVLKAKFGDQVSVTQAFGIAAKPIYVWIKKPAVTPEKPSVKKHAKKAVKKPVKKGWTKNLPAQSGVTPVFPSSIMTPEIQAITDRVNIAPAAYISRIDIESPSPSTVYLRTKYNESLLKAIKSLPARYRKWTGNRWAIATPKLLELVDALDKAGLSDEALKIRVLHDEIKDLGATNP
jgi:hypothetical protein